MTTKQDPQPVSTDADNYWRDKNPDCWAMVASVLVTAAILGTSILTAVVA